MTRHPDKALAVWILVKPPGLWDFITEWLTPTCEAAAHERWQT